MVLLIGKTMYLNVLKIISYLILIVAFSWLGNLALAETPQQFCDGLKSAGIDDKCVVCGDCAVIVTVVGNHECKQCPETGSCKLAHCNECQEYPACVE